MDTNNLFQDIDLFNEGQQVISSSLTLVTSVSINGFVIYTLLTLPRRYRFPRSERLLLLSMAICGMGTGFFVTLPTLIIASIKPEAYNSNNWPNKDETNYWCQGFAIVGIIFMTSCSWFAALLSINRYYIITRVFESRMRSSYRRLNVVQGCVWLIVTVFYVILFLMVNAEIGLPDFTQVPSSANVSINSTFSRHENMSDNFTSHLNQDYSYLMRASFFTFDPMTAIACSPNWRQVPNYLVASAVMFFLIPFLCVVISYIRIARIAYKQIKKIHSVIVRPSVCSSDSNGNKQPGDPLVKLSNFKSSYWFKHATLAVGAIALPDVSDLPGRNLNRGDDAENRKKSAVTLRRSRFSESDNLVGKGKVNLSSFIVIAVFFFTWAPYTAYFIVDAESYYDYVWAELANNRTLVAPWRSPFSSQVSYVITWCALAGRTWSIVIYALMNRKLRLSISKKLIFLKPCILRGKIFKCFGIRSIKIAPSFPRNESSRVFTISKNADENNQEKCLSQPWAITDTTQGRPSCSKTM